MKITDHPATVWHIAQAMKCIATPELKQELRNTNWENNEELGANLLMLLLSYPEQILNALYHLNREEATMEELKAIEDGEELARLIEAIIKNNQPNVSTFLSFLGKALSQVSEPKKASTN